MRMEMVEKNFHKYYIASINYKSKITIGVVGESIQITQTAIQIIKDKDMLDGFPASQAALIGFMAGMQN